MKFSKIKNYLLKKENMQIKAKRRHRQGKEQNPETKAALSKKAIYYCL